MRLWASDDFKKADSKDRMYMHMMDPARYRLTEEETQYLNLLKRVFAVISETPIRAEAMRMIEQLEGFSHVRSAYRVHQDALDLFANLVHSNIKIDRAMQVERLHLLIRSAQDQDKDLEFILECEKLLMKVQGTDRPDPEQLMSTELPPVYLLDDPSLLLEAQEAEIDETEQDEE